MSHVNKNWIIAVLIIVIVLLVSLFMIKRVIDYNRFFDLLSFVSSIISIILSIFAIFYSYHSIVKSDESAESVSEALSKIEVYNENMKNNNNQLLQTVILIKDKVVMIEAKQNVRDKNDVQEPTSIKKQIIGNKPFES